MQEPLEITPGVGIGPYRIGMPAAEVLAILQIPLLEAGFFSMYSPRCVSYRDPARGLVVDVDVRVGLCFKIKARAGFTGKTSQGISLNMKASDALQLDNSLYLDDFYGTLESKIFPGYYIELDDPDPLPGKFNHLPVVGIGVTNPSFFRELEKSDLSNLKEANGLRYRMLEYYLASKAAS